MRSGQSQFFLFHIKSNGLGNHHFMVFGISDGSLFFYGRERIQFGMNTVFFELPLYDRVVVPKDESVFFRLILYNPEFGVHIVLHVMVVSVQMVRSNVH